jgi:hypothetical protein
MAAEWKDMSDEWAEVASRWLVPERFNKFLKERSSPSSVAFLSVRFPLGSVVEASGLNKADLNGVAGCVVQYARDRVGVKFTSGVCAVKPEHLHVVRSAPSPDDSASSSDGDQEGSLGDTADGYPVEQTVPVKEEQAEEPEVGRATLQQGRQLTSSFIEAVMNDVPPPDDERAFWGFARVGEDFAGLNDVVLNAWTGLLRYKLLEEELLMKALVHGRIKQFFESKCRTVMREGFPKVEGIKLGLGNTEADLLSCCERLAITDFQGLEWETLD